MDWENARHPSDVTKNGIATFDDVIYDWKKTSLVCNLDIINVILRSGTRILCLCSAMRRKTYNSMWFQRRSIHSDCGSGLFHYVYSLVTTLTAGWEPCPAVNSYLTAVCRRKWKSPWEISLKNWETSANSAAALVSSRFWFLFYTQ